MTTSLPAAAARLALAAVSAALLASCGGGDISFGGDDDDTEATVTFEGNIDSVSPVSGRDIVVFIYEIDEDEQDNDVRCPCPPDPNDPAPATPLTGKTAVLSSGDDEFTIPGLQPGAYTIVFLLDEAGDDADREIDDGDEIAILDDVDCELDDVSGNFTVTLEDIDIVFDDVQVDCRDGDDNDPAAGHARADQIRQQRTVDDGDDEEVD